MLVLLLMAVMELMVIRWTRLLGDRTRPPLLQPFIALSGHGAT